MTLPPESSSPSMCQKIIMTVDVILGCPRTSSFVMWSKFEMFISVWKHFISAVCFFFFVCFFCLFFFVFVFFLLFFFVVFSRVL